MFYIDFNMGWSMKKLLVLFCCFSFFLPSVFAEEDFAPNSKSAILIEVSTGNVIYEKNSDERLAPASMTKVMSMLLIMEAIESGKLGFDDLVMISKNAASMGGSQVFLQEGESYKVSELLKGIAIASGNDAVVAMAEKVGGSIEGFVRMMNERAKSLGLVNTNFMNPHGLDQDNHYSCARDMSIMGRELVKHEKILEFTSIYEDYLKKPDGSSTWLVNTNRLVRFYNGVDGLKTGFTSTAGYCITTTAKRDGMRILSVVMGAETSDKRSEDTVSLLNYGFNTYQVQKILEAGSSMGEIHIPSSKKEKISVSLKEEITYLKKVNEEEKKFHTEVEYFDVKAPAKKGDVVGKVKVFDESGNVCYEGDLQLDEDAEKAGILDFFGRNFRFLTSGI